MSRVLVGHDEKNFYKTIRHTEVQLEKTDLSNSEWFGWNRSHDVEATRKENVIFQKNVQI